MENYKLVNFFNQKIGEITRRQNELTNSLEKEILVICEQKEKALYYVDGLREIIRDNSELLDIIIEQLEQPKADILDAFK